MTSDGARSFGVTPKVFSAFGKNKTHSTPQNYWTWPYEEDLNSSYPYGFKNVDPTHQKFIQQKKEKYFNLPFQASYEGLSYGGCFTNWKMSGLPFLSDEGKGAVSFFFSFFAAFFLCG